MSLFVVIVAIGQQTVIYFELVLWNIDIAIDSNFIV